jgi:rRNA maturation endonuclease Nob1
MENYYDKTEKDIDRNISNKYFKSRGKPKDYCEICGKPIYKEGYRICYKCNFG